MNTSTLKVLFSSLFFLFSLSCHLFSVLIITSPHFGAFSSHLFPSFVFSPFVFSSLLVSSPHFWSSLLVSSPRFWSSLLLSVCLISSLLVLSFGLLYSLLVFFSFLFWSPLLSFPLQPVQGFDYAKQHMGQQGEETLAVTKETLVLSLPVRDAPLTQDKGVLQDGTASKRPQSTEIHRRSVCFTVKP